MINEEGLQPQLSERLPGVESLDGAPSDGANLDTILSIPVTVQVVLGSTSMPVSTLMRLGRGALIALDQKVGDPVNIVVNGRIVARGEVVVYDEESSKFGVSLIEVVASALGDRN